MAYNTNPYFLGNYSNPYMSMFNQQYPQQQPPQQQTQQSPNSIIWVNSEEEAQTYPVAPNNAVTLWQTTKPVVFLKQADASGKPTLTAYDLIERKPQEKPTISGDNYVTNEELEKVLVSIRKLNDSIADIRDDLVIIKDDVYGIAGKKHRKEDAADE